MMDRPSSSTNPLFIEQDDDMSSYVTKSHLFGAQQVLHQEQQAMNDRIDNLAVTSLPFGNALVLVFGDVSCLLLQKVEMGMFKP